MNSFYATNGTHNIAKVCFRGSWSYEVWRLAERGPDGRPIAGGVDVRLGSFAYGPDVASQARGRAFEQAAEMARNDGARGVAR